MQQPVQGTGCCFKGLNGWITYANGEKNMSKLFRRSLIILSLILESHFVVKKKRIGGGWAAFMEK